jgi:hypothetical protein
MGKVPVFPLPEQSSQASLHALVRLVPRHWTRSLERELQKVQGGTDHMEVEGMNRTEAEGMNHMAPGKEVRFHYHYL